MFLFFIIIFQYVGNIYFIFNIKFRELFPFNSLQILTFIKNAFTLNGALK